MLAKPLIFLLTFILTLANMVFLLLPLSIILLPLYIIYAPFFKHAGADLFMMIVAVMSVLTVFYMFIDLLFGRTARRLNKGAKRFEEMTAVPEHAKIISVFKRLKRKYGVDNVDLYLDVNTDEVNAYAIGGARRQCITITMGLIFAIHSKTESKSQYIEAVSGILGHEMSHLINKDFLPGLLAASSEAANNHVAKLLRIVLIIFATIFRFIPVIGLVIRNAILSIYNIILGLSNFFFTFIFRPLYSFILKWFGRSIEYRCDYDSARAVGGRAMALALKSLGKGSYFSIFSTHPKTKKRIKHIKDVHPASGYIKEGRINAVANVISMLMVVTVMCGTVFATDWKNVQTNYDSYVYQPTKYIALKIRHDVMTKYYQYVN